MQQCSTSKIETGRVVAQCSQSMNFQGKKYHNPKSAKIRPSYQPKQPDKKGICLRGDREPATALTELERFYAEMEEPV